MTAALVLFGLSTSLLGLDDSGDMAGLIFIAGYGDPDGDIAESAA